MRYNVAWLFGKTFAYTFRYLENQKNPGKQLLETHFKPEVFNLRFHTCVAGLAEDRPRVIPQNLWQKLRCEALVFQRFFSCPLIRDFEGVLGIAGPFFEEPPTLEYSIMLCDM